MLHSTAGGEIRPVWFASAAITPELTPLPNANAVMARMGSEVVLFGGGSGAGVHEIPPRALGERIDAAIHDLSDVRPRPMLGGRTAREICNADKQTQAARPLAAHQGGERTGATQ